MKQKFTPTVMFVLTLILTGICAFNGSAQTSRNNAAGKTSVAYAGAVSTVVINEVYGGSEAGGLYNADFIELYNTSDAPVNISDWSVQYYTAGQINGGAPTSTAHIPDATILAAKGYYVIRVSPNNRTGADLPCNSLDASASFAETGIASDGGKIVLSSTGADLPDCTSSLNVIDRVGYGSTPIVCNETVNAEQPVTSTSVQRRSGGIDTDNNNLDFIAFITPTPCAAQFAPTSAMVNVSGRVTNASGRGIARALISMTDSAGAVRGVYTTSFGFYHFADVEAGQSIILEIKTRKYNFAEPTRVFSLNEAVSAVNFIAY